MLIEKQLGAVDGKRRLPETQESWIPVMPERAELASLPDTGDIRSVKMRETQIAAVQAMADSCSRVKPTRRAVSRRTELLKAAEPTPPRAIINDEFPLRCHPPQKDTHGRYSVSASTV